MIEGMGWRKPPSPTLKVLCVVYRRNKTHLVRVRVKVG